MTGVLCKLRWVVKLLHHHFIGMDGFATSFIGSFLGGGGGGAWETR